MSTQQLENASLQVAEAIAQIRQERIQQEIRYQIIEALQFSKYLSAEQCYQEIRGRLATVQRYCQTVNKVFIVVEQEITCNQYQLGGYPEDTAILFRGPREDASVAICTTRKGSLLYRNDSPWRVYRNVGDVNPSESLD